MDLISYALSKQFTIQQIKEMQGISMKKVSVLPATGAPNVIYLVPKTSTGADDIFDEYAWMDGKWERIGSSDLRIDDTAASENKTWSSQKIQNELDKKVDSVNGKTGVVTLTAADVKALPEDTVIPPAYTLPAASAETLGGVKIGEGINVASDGTITASNSSLTITEILPNPEEQAYNSGKMYLQDEDVFYLSKNLTQDPSVRNANSLPFNPITSAHAKVGNYIYLFGGQGDNPNSYTRSNRIVKYDMVNKTLTTLSVVLPVELGEAAAAAVGPNIYLFGGRVYPSTTSSVFNLQNLIYLFDTKTETLKTISEKLTVPKSDIVACAVKEKIYLFGGRLHPTNFARSNDVLIFDSVSQRIEREITNIIPDSVWGYGCASVKDVIYLFGGYISGKEPHGHSDGIIIFDTKTNSLKRISSRLPFEVINTAAVTINDDIYLFGGRNANNDSISQIIKFNVNSEHALVLMTNLPSGVQGSIVESNDLVVFILGGGSTSQHLEKNVLECVFNYKYDTFKLLRATEDSIGQYNQILMSDGEGGIHYVDKSSLLPVATATLLGGVKIGKGIKLELDGTISVETGAIQSVNGKTGAVKLTAADVKAIPLTPGANGQIAVSDGNGGIRFETFINRAEVGL